MTKKRLSFLFIIVCFLILFVGCSEQEHVHTWEKYVDYNEEYHYKVCKDSMSHSEKERHTFDQGNVITPATKDSIGYIEYKCVFCGRRKTTTIPTLGGSNYVNKIPEERYLKEKISDATSVYYMSDVNGGYGDDGYVFEYTVLPEEYEEVEYIESTGDRYIDVEVDARAGIEAEIKYYLYSLAQVQCILGARTDDTRIYVLMAEKDQYEVGYGSYYMQGHVTAGVTEIAKVKVYAGKQTLTVNNQIVISGGLEGDIDLHKNLYLFGANHQSKYYMKGRVYYCKIWLDGELVRNLIPCYRIENGIAGLYDLVSGRFFISNVEQVTGVTGGETLPIEETQDRLPEEFSSQYERVSYIKTTGEEYIDTKFVPSQETSIDVSFMSESADNYSFSVFGSAGWSCCDRAFESYVWDGAVKVNFGKVEHHFTSEFLANERYCLKSNKNTFTLSSSFGTETAVLTNIEAGDNSFSSPQSMVLFSLNRNGEVDTPTKGNYLYYCKIYDGDTLVRSFVPVRSVLSGEYGLFELVENKFYGAKKSRLAPFAKGKEVERDKGVPSEYIQLDYIESNGTGYIDTKYNPYGKDVKAEIDAENNNGEGILIGGYTDGYRFHIVSTYESGWVPGYGIPYLYTKNHDTARHIYTLTSKYFSIDDLIFPIEGWAGAKSIETPDCDLYIFDGNYSDGTRSPLENVKLYSCKIYENGVLVRDYVPVQRVEDGEIGLYDKVFGEFYGSAIKVVDMFIITGKTVGHAYDEGVVLKESTLSEEGKIEYTCTCCGRKRYVSTPSKAYQVTFEGDEGVKEIRIFNSMDPEDYIVGVTAYSRNINSNNYSKQQASVMFQVVLQDGYEMVRTTKSALSQEDALVYVTGVLDGNTKVTIHTQKIA